MSRFLGRVGLAAARRPWRTVAAWLVALLAAFAFAGGLGGEPHDDYTVAGTRSQAATDLLTARFPEMSGSDARVVLHARDGRALDGEVVDAVRQRLLALPRMGAVPPPRWSADRDTALFGVVFRVPVTEFHGTEGVDLLRRAAAPATSAGLQVELGGMVPENASAAGGIAELLGVVAALVVLGLALRSLVAAGLPLLVAFCGLGFGSGVIALLAAVTDISTSAPTIASMVGLGVGIDYALLLVSRQAEGLRSGLTPVAAAQRSAATAGTSVVVAGSTVLVSLLGLRLAGLPVYASFGYATAAVVSAVMVAAVTLVPALCALAGTRVLPRRDRRVLGSAAASGIPVAVLTAPRRPTRTARWAGAVAARPARGAVVSLLLLLALAAPVLGMRTWPQDAGSQPTSTTIRRAYDLVAAEYGPGANGPFLVTVDLGRVDAARLPALTASLRATAGVAEVGTPTLDRGGDVAVIEVEPRTGPQDEATSRLLDRLRADVLPAGVEITGTVAAFADISDLLSRRLWIVVGFVVSLSLLLLTWMFRAPIVAVKAAAMNLLSVAAAYGALTAVFQNDAGAHALGLPHAVAVSSWVPILMFTVLFGLSMDYEVFLLSRVRELWLATGDARGSVVVGLAATGRVISSAAAIMVAVFLGFAADPDVTVKMIGLGMAAAVVVDATLVRLVLVPATMALLGRWNWWLPAWLDRMLPPLHLEAEEGPVPTTCRPGGEVAARVAREVNEAVGV